MSQHDYEMGRRAGKDGGVYNPPHDTNSFFKQAFSGFTDKEWKDIQDCKQGFQIEKKEKD